MPRAENNGVRIYYEDFGPREDTRRWPDEEGPEPLVLAHGFGVDLTMWDWQIEPLSWRRRVILWDARGHGRSAAPQADVAYSMPIFARDLEAVLDAAHVERAIVGGMSFGGMIALQFAVDFPQRMRALILSDSVTRAPEAARDNHEPPRRSGLFDAMMRRPDLTPDLPALAVPALVIYGEHDQRVAEGIPALAGGLQRRRVVCLKGCSHGTSSQRPDAWTEVVQTFLEDIEVGRPIDEEITQ